MTTKIQMRNAAEMIADALEQICGAASLAEYAADAARESSTASLSQYESLVRIRLGADYDAEAWNDAMEIIQERHALEAP